MCDPWEKAEIFESIEYDLPKDECTHCLPGVNFINILRSTFVPIFFVPKNYKAIMYLEKSSGKHFCMKNLHIK
jgi:hypothetical protein